MCQIGHETIRADMENANHHLLPNSKTDVFPYRKHVSEIKGRIYLERKGNKK